MFSRYHDPDGHGHKGSNRVNRGGSWNDIARNVRAAYRNRDHLANRWNDQGFRLARAQTRAGVPVPDPAVVRSAGAGSHLSPDGENPFGRRCAGRAVDAAAKARRWPDSSGAGR